MLRELLLALMLPLAAATHAAAEAGAPRVPAGRDPGGVAIAILGPGLDYGLPTIAARLARDGEGELVGWDLVANDRLPFDIAGGESSALAGGDVTALAHVVLADAAPVRLVPLRVGLDVPATLARAVTFAAAANVRVVVVPMWSAVAAEWEPFAAAARRHATILFILAAADGDETGRQYPAQFDLPNAMVVSAGTAQQRVPGFGGRQRTIGGGALAAAVSARVAARILTREPGIDMQRLQRQIAAEAAPR